MLGAKSVMATIAVKDLDAAKQFYKDVLGLETVIDRPYLALYKSGSSMLQVYASEFAGTNQSTNAMWDVSDIDTAVADLKSRGVTFEHYQDMPGTTLDGDVHVFEGEKAAWFKDPDGNILCLHSALS